MENRRLKRLHKSFKKPKRLRDKRFKRNNYEISLFGKTDNNKKKLDGCRYLGKNTNLRLDLI